MTCLEDARCSSTARRYLYRAFHALPDLRTLAGEPTGALRGVLAHAAHDCARTCTPDYFAVRVRRARAGPSATTCYPAVQGAPPADAATDLAAQIEPLHEAGPRARLAAAR
ncbi:MAG: hypothetical protein MZV65_48975 [Chromatiales bacterium]|nr:hypothetical protein [Chromatiales bacterium]